jgi:hypothetical protein
MKTSLPNQLLLLPMVETVLSIHAFPQNMAWLGHENIQAKISIGRAPP